MKNLAFALAALALSAPAAAAAPDKGLAPAVTRAPSAQPRQPACDPAKAPCPQTSPAAASARPSGVQPSSAQQYRSALRSAAPSEDVELDNGVTNAMSQLMAAGRCVDAVGLARRAGRNELAARAQQLCK